MDSPGAKLGKLNVTVQPSRLAYAGLNVMSVMLAKSEGMVSAKEKSVIVQPEPPLFTSVVVTVDRLVVGTISLATDTAQLLPPPMSTW